MKNLSSTSAPTAGKYGFRNALILTIVATHLGLGIALAETATSVSETQQAVAVTKQVMSDGWITTKVKSEILADSASKGFTVHVKTTQGTVVLKGALADEDAISRIKAIAEKIEGVRSLDATELKVGTPDK